MEVEFSIGPYDFVRYLGKGGMAAVWEARKPHSHLDLGRFAIKFLLDQYSADHDVQKRFLKEAEIQSQLHHPNIVRVSDFFEADQRSYMVMEYVEPPQRHGETANSSSLPLGLDERIQSFPGLQLTEILTISKDILSALHYAHEHPLHVVHRDIKPANVLLSVTGHAVLTDFGIAKVLSNTTSGTIVARAMGTLDYMSPEQIIDPTKISRCSDVYSFGCLLYEMLSGKPPFAGTTARSTSAFDYKSQHVILHDPPPPLISTSLPISYALRNVVFRCLKKEPAQRYQTCKEVSEALMAVMTTISSPPPHLDNRQGGTTIEVIKERSPEQLRGQLIPRSTANSNRAIWKWVGTGLAVALLGLLGFNFIGEKHATTPHEGPDNSHTATQGGLKTPLQTDAPVFSPPSGSFAAPVKVTLSSTSPEASIYYTTDSSIPTMSSKSYTGAIHISSSETIKAIAAASGEAASAVTISRYSINKVSVSSPPPTDDRDPACCKAGDVACRKAHELPPCTF